jgi:hypothetical protein
VILLPSLLAGSLGNLLERQAAKSAAAILRQEALPEATVQPDADRQDSLLIASLDADKKPTVPLSGPHYHHLRMGAAQTRPKTRE